MHCILYQLLNYRLVQIDLHSFSSFKVSFLEVKRTAILRSLLTLKQLTCRCLIYRDHHRDKCLPINHLSVRLNDKL